MAKRAKPEPKRYHVEYLDWEAGKNLAAERGSMATELELSATQIADKIETTDVEAWAWLLRLEWAWLLGLEFAHDQEAEDAKALVVKALRKLKE